MSTPEAVVAATLRPNRILLAFNGQRIFDVTGVSIDIVHQDDGLTLKVLVKDLPAEQKARATTDHMARFGQSLNPDGSTQP